MVHRRWAAGGTPHEGGLYSAGVGSTTGEGWGLVGLEGFGSQSQEQRQGLHPGRRGGSVPWLVVDTCEVISVGEAATKVLGVEA